MRRIFSALLALLMLCTLAACGESKEPEQKVEVKGNLSEVSEALGYDFLGYNTSGTTLEFDAAAVVDDSIGQATYKNGKSNVTLRMTLDKDRAEGLAGFRNAGTAGAIEAPTDVFSKLSIQVVDNSTYFCEFTYTNCGCSCYLSLAETKTNLDLYSTLLIDYINQLYNMEGIPSYVYKVDPSLALDDKAPEETSQSAEESVSAEGSASAEASGETSAEVSETEPEEEPSEEPAETETEEEPAEEPAETEQKEEEPAEGDSEKEDSEKTDSEKEDSEDEDSGKKDKTEKKKEEKQKKSEGKITLTYYDITLVHVGDSYTFEPKGGEGGYTWKSANKKVATVTADGTVKAVGKGTTTVTVTSKDGLSAEVIVRVPKKK